MSQKLYNILFLCTGNSARSIMGEALLNRYGADKFKAYSAGSKPKSHIHPMTLEILANLGFETAKLRAKNWQEFAQPQSPKMDFIITVCDCAAAEICPIWPGQPISAHWGIEDPAAAKNNQRDAFLTALRYMQNRINLLQNLPLESLDKLSLKNRLDQIGKSQG